MKRYDVRPASEGGQTGQSRLVVVLQNEHLSDLATVVVAPLFLRQELPEIRRLRVIVQVKRKAYLVAFDRLAALPVSRLGPAVANLADDSYAFSDALDFLFKGF